MSADDDAPIFLLPTAPAGPWDHLTKNEQTWIEFIRVISSGSDPGVTPDRVRALRELLEGPETGIGKRQPFPDPQSCSRTSTGFVFLRFL